SNTDAKTTTTFRLNVPGNGVIPTLELRSDVRDAVVANARPYYPKSKIPPTVLSWLDNAITAGRVPEGVVVFDGPVKGFPFDQGQGHFNASFSVQNLTLNYANGWPALENANVDVVFDNESLDAKVSEGFVADNLLFNSEVNIADLRKGVVDIRGRSKSPLSNLLGFVHNSPVGKGFGGQLHTLNLEGDGDAQLEIRFPAKEREKTTVTGYVNLDNAAVSLSDISHRLEAVTGRLGFSKTALRANKVQASLFGSPVSIDIVPSVSDDGIVDATMLVARGSLAPENLTLLSGDPSKILQGPLPWQSIVRFPRANDDSNESPNIIVETDFDGAELKLPPPFYVAAGETRPMMLDLRFPEPNEIDAEFSFGDDVRLVGNLKKTDEKGWSFARANLSFGPDFPALTSTDRVVVSGELPVFDLDGWLKLGDGEEGGTPLQEIVRSVNVQAGEVIAFGQRFSDVGFKLDHNIREWLVQISGSTIDGSIFVPFESGVARPIIMDMTRLHLVASDQNDKNEPADEAADPRKIASLQIKVADFIYGDMKFGALNAQLRQEPNGLRLVNLQTDAPSFETDASGLWAFGANGHKSEFDLRLTSSNVASTMTDLGYGDALSADQAELTLNLNWDGPPSQRFLHKLSGTASVGVSKGQLTTVRPKAGRVFGLLSVAALPRRLSLDFRDVFDKGLGFDSISGDFSFEKGNAYTNNLVLAGPAADVGIVGRTGLVSKDYDQTAVVRAELGNSLPVAGALLGGPGAGAALLVFSQLFKEPLKQMSAVQYRITGSWEEPVIEQIGVSARQGNAG
ncbi:MAG: YhdP family protein, partial [Pseudomonadota bacterium]